MTTSTTADAVLSTPTFNFRTYTILAWLPDRKRKVVFQTTYPKFRDKNDLQIYRKVYLEKISSQKKPTPYDEAVLQLLDSLEDYLYGDLL